MRRAWLLALVAVACSAEVATPVEQSECVAPQFVGCQADCGKGVRECRASGVWGPCRCVVVDASLGADAESDASADVESDASTDAESDASAGDASADAFRDTGADTGDAGGPG